MASEMVVLGSNVSVQRLFIIQSPKTLLYVIKITLHFNVDVALPDIFRP